MTHGTILDYVKENDETNVIPETDRSSVLPHYTILVPYILDDDDDDGLLLKTNHHICMFSFYFTETPKESFCSNDSLNM